MNYKELLFNKDKVLTFYPRLAVILNKYEEIKAEEMKEKTGKTPKSDKNCLGKAIVINQVSYWVDRNKELNKNYRDGYYWCYSSYKRWVEVDFPYWSIDTVKRLFTSLEKDGIFVSSNYNKMSIDRTKWYRIDCERLQQIIDLVEEYEKTEQDNIDDEPNNASCYDDECNLPQSKSATCHNESVQLASTNTIDYINRLNSDNNNTNNNEYVSSLKDGGKNIYAFSEKKGQKNSSEDSDEEYQTTEEKLKYEIFPILDDYMEENYEYEYENGMNLILEDIIMEFYHQYFMKFAKYHRIMKIDTYKKIVDKYFMPPDEMEDVYDFKDYKSMIECYFKINYNKRGNYNGKINLSLAHFFSENILKNLYHKIQC